MKRIAVYPMIASTLLSLALLLCVPTRTSAAATPNGSDRPAACSYHTAEGAWGFSYFGITLNSGPIMAVGAFELDGTGNVNGKQTVNFQGNIPDVTFSGTFTIGPDCTGQMTVDVYQNGEVIFSQVVLATVWIENSNAVRMVSTDGDIGFVLDGKKISRPNE
jgi:hypothetical protein